MHLPPEKLIIATRESRLALWQAEHVKEHLQRHYPRCRITLLGMTTRGDQILDRSLAKIGGKGLFVKELEQALQDGRADLAVHSLKDMPMELPEGFELSTILPREDARDAFVSNHHSSLDELPQQACVGTSSVRRSAFLRARYPHLRIKPLRGNLDTRLAKLDAHEFDAIILASAGLTRLGTASRIRAWLAPEHMLPAPAQGALGLEIASHRADVKNCLAVLNHVPSQLACLAERALARILAGSCSTPIAAHARWENECDLNLEAWVASPQGDVLLQAQQTSFVNNTDAAEALGHAVAAHLLKKGARAVLERAGHELNQEQN